MNKLSRRDFIKLSLTGLLGSSYYEATSLNRIKYEFHDLYLPSWNADGLKIAFLTDFHIRGPSEVARALNSIEMARSQKPDLILFGGDFVEAKQYVRLSHIRQVLDAFSDISIPCYGVYGNHDYMSPNRTILFEEIKKSNIKILVDELANIYNIQIIGIADPFALPNRPIFFKDKKTDSQICLAHAPDSVGCVPNISLQLSGHSHGGQICLPFGLPLARRYGALKYTSGYYLDAPVPLYVSRGIGTTEINLRLFCPPEVSILTLRKSS